MLLATAD